MRKEQNYVSEDTSLIFDCIVVNVKAILLADEQYVKLKKYVRDAEIESKKEPEIRGFTAREYIQSEMGNYYYDFIR